MKFNYELFRSSRKTICISVKSDKVIVRAPLRMPLGKIESFVEEKSDWVLKKLSEYSCDEQLTSYEKIYVKGELKTLVVGGNDFIGADCVTVKKIANVKKLYLKEFSAEFLNVFNAVVAKCGLRAKSVSFRAYRARWGCCDVKKNIVFNYKLLMLPVGLWECVIVHELCHTVFMDHSKNFKDLARSIMPNYDITRKRLKDYACVCRLY